MNKIITQDEFVSEIILWTMKGHYPLEQITFLESVDGKKLVAIQSYIDPKATLYIANKSYENYQAVLTRVGALLDKSNFQNHTRSGELETN